jgi:hypothetical protein
MERDTNGHLVIKEGAGLYLEHTSGGSTATFGVWDKGNLTGGVMVQQINGQTSVKISGDSIDIDGVVNKLTAKAVTVLTLTSLGDITAIGTTHAPDLVCGSSLTLYNETTNWHNQTIVISVGSTGFTKNFRLADGTTWEHKVITDVSYNTATIRYVGN